MIEIDRRKLKNFTENEDIYKNRNIDKLISKERRSADKEKLLDIKDQQSAWVSSMVICIIINFTFITLAMIGWLNGNN